LVLSVLADHEDDQGVQELAGCQSDLLAVSALSQIDDPGQA
jgi:hypothetical protein